MVLNGALCVEHAERAVAVSGPVRRIAPSICVTFNQ